MYSFLQAPLILWQEQKCYWQKSRGTNDLLFIVSAVLKEVKKRKLSFSLVLIDYIKAVDMTPHTWIIECFEMAVMINQIRGRIKSIMKTWRVELTYGQETLGGVTIYCERDIFGLTPNFVLFVMHLILLTHIMQEKESK